MVGNAVASYPGSVRNAHAAEQNTCTGIGHAYGIQRRTAATLVSTWQYADNLHDRRLTGIAHLGGGAPAGAQPRSYAYVTDAANRLLAQTESVAGTTTRTWAYGYDPADRLTDALATPGGTYAYTLDAADNLLEQQSPTGTASSTYNTLNQIVQRSGQPLTYDAAGNLTGDGQRTYAWDAEQRLVRIGYTGTRRATTFRYDSLGRRTAVIDSDGSTATETRYLWCGERICQARDATDTVTRRYYDEGELAVAATGDVASFYAEDHLGSIRDLRLGDGQVLASYDYDPYGNPTRVSETGGIHADYRYAGLVNHAPSGLYLAHYRAYSPQTGRWIGRDPIGEAGGVNLYGYVGGNPITRVDVLGLACIGVQCYTTAAEAAAAQSGNYDEYYGLACAGGDDYACFARHIARNDNFWGHIANNRLRDRIKERATKDQQCLDEERIVEQVRKDLAKQYADSLPKTNAGARRPSAKDIAQMHWDVFAQFGLPPDTFGGTPTGSVVVLPRLWCPQCGP